MSAELLKGLREERSLERRLTKVRARLGPLKREWAESNKTFGLSNEALLVELTRKKANGND